MGKPPAEFAEFSSQTLRRTHTVPVTWTLWRWCRVICNCLWADISPKACQGLAPPRARVKAKETMTEMEFLTNYGFCRCPRCGQCGRTSRRFSVIMSPKAGLSVMFGQAKQRKVEDVCREERQQWRTSSTPELPVTSKMHLRCCDLESPSIRKNTNAPSATSCTSWASSFRTRLSMFSSLIDPLQTHDV